MRFVLGVAWRELRSSWHRLALFFLCIGIGVAAIASLRSFTSILRSSTGYHARALFAGDVRAESAFPWTPEKRSILERFSVPPWADWHTEIIELETMARATAHPESSPALVELRAVGPDFPLRGDVRLSNGERYSHDLLARHGALVSASLLNRLRLKQGDPITIGTLVFTIRGSIERIPGNALNFSPMPRVAIDYEDAEAAGLTGLGSRLHYAWLFTTAPGREEALVAELQNALGKTPPRQSVASFRFVEAFLTASLANIDRFSGLAGLSVLVLAGIGIASVSRVFVQQKLPTMAILKCLGGRNLQVLGAYLTLLLALSLAGGLLGLALAAGIVEVITQYATRFLPMDSTPALSTAAALHGLVFGCTLTALFTIPPLLAIRQVKPLLVLRRLDTAGPADPVQLIAVACAALGLLGLAFWEWGTYRGARTFVAGVATTAIVLRLAGTATMALVRRLQRIPFFIVRHGLGNLHRPGNQTNAILFAVGMGALLMIAVQVHGANLQRAFDSDIESLSADMFLIDIQKDQPDDVAASLRSLGGRDVRIVPVVGARLVGLKWNSEEAARARYAGLVRSRLGNGFRLTYRPDLNRDETIVKGTYWNGEPSTDPEVSVEEPLADWLMLRIGDTLSFDVSGRKIDARVTSVRRIDRRVRMLSSRIPFEVIFRPGVLENASHAFIAALKGPPPGDARAALQNALLDRFPNVTVADILDDLEEARTRVRDVSVGISILGAFVLGCGILTLIGSVAMTKYARLYQTAILKTLGARKRVVLQSTMIEYGVLGLLAGTIGAAAATAVTWALSTYGNPPMPWWPRPGMVLAGVVGTTVLVTTAGVLSTWDVIVRKPLLIMREE